MKADREKVTRLLKTARGQLDVYKRQVQQQVEDKRLENKEIERLLESDNEQYVERLAKDEYGYAYPDETVYIDTSGNGLSRGHRNFKED